MFADEEERTKVKICGLTSLHDARFVSGARVHYMGFIFYEESPRFITPAEAGAIINWIEGPECVGVFVNQPLDDVNMIARQTGVELIQLHGNESPDYCKLIDKPIIKVIHVEPGSSEEELKEAIAPYLSVADYLMFDTKIEGKWGGTGKTFDWSLIENICDGKPFFLSGGINVHNVRKACKKINPYAIDLSSSLESGPGVKDFDKVEEFMDEMYEIWEEQEMGTL